LDELLVNSVFIDYEGDPLPLNLTSETHRDVQVVPAVVMVFRQTFPFRC
jgi:hypothetical protein